MTYDELHSKVKGVMNDASLTQEQKSAEILDLYTEYLKEAQQKQEAEKKKRDYDEGYAAGLEYAKKKYELGGFDPESPYDLPTDLDDVILVTEASAAPSHPEVIETIGKIIGSNDGDDKKLKDLDDYFFPKGGDGEDGDGQGGDGGQGGQGGRPGGNQPGGNNPGGQGGTPGGNQPGGGSQPGGQGTQPGGNGGQGGQGGNPGGGNQPGGSGGNGGSQPGGNGGNKPGGGTQPGGNQPGGNGTQPGQTPGGQGTQGGPTNQIPPATTGVNGDPVAGEKKITGSDDPDDWFGSNHVISKKIGDKIRAKEPEDKNRKTDPGWGLDSTVDGVERTIIPILKKIKGMRKNGNEETKDPIIDGIMERIVSRRRGIAPWREWLKDFMKRRSNTELEKDRRMRMGVYRLSGIRTHGIQQKKHAMKKCVVYVDTTGSLYSYLSLLVAEVKKLAKDCEFQVVDINTFTTYVIHHDNISHSTLKDENWGITDHTSGGTAIDCVYTDLAKHYCVNGILKSEVDAIIIMTDDSGVMSGNLKDYVGSLGTNVFEKMFYLVFCPGYDDITEAEKTCASYIFPSSRMRIMVFSQFINSLKNNKYETNESYNMEKTYRKVGRLSEMALSKRRATVDDIDIETVNNDDVAKINTKAKIDAHRSAGTLDQLDLFKPIIDLMKKLFPNAVLVKNPGDVSITDADEAYYISDSADYILMKGEISKENKNVEKFVELTKNVNIKTFFGNIKLVNIRDFTEFPPGFPKNVQGDFVLKFLMNLKNFDNAPVYASHPQINVANPQPGFKMLQNKYIQSLERGGETDFSGEKKTIDHRIFAMNRINKKNESVDEVIRRRIMLGESYISEMALAPKLRALYPTKSKPQMRGGSTTQKDWEIQARQERFQKDQEDWLKSTEIYKHNKSVWEDVINPILSIGIGDIKDDDVEVITDKMDIRKSSVAAKSRFKGLKLFTTNDQIISAVYAKLNSVATAKLIYLRGDDDKHVTDPEELKQETRNRWDIFHQTIEFLNKTGVGVENFPERKDSTVETTMLPYLYFSLAMLNGSYADIEKKDKESPRHYKFNADTVLDDPYNSNSSLAGKEIVDDVLKFIFGDAQRRTDDSWKVYLPTGGYTTISFSQKEHNNQAAKDKFVNCAEESIADKDLNIYSYFSDNLLRAFAIGASLRFEDGLPTYPLEDILNADRDELIDMVYSMRDVKIFDTTLKVMSTKSKDLSNFDEVNPSDVLLLFPDRCNQEYDIKVDIDKEALKYMTKRATREIQNAGIYSAEKKSKATTNEVFDNFVNVAAYMNENPRVYEDAKKSLENALKQLQSDAWSKDDTTYVAFCDSIDHVRTLVQFVEDNFIKDFDKIMASGDQKRLKNIESTLDKMVDDLGNVVDYLETIINSGDAEEVVNASKEFNKLEGKFVAYYRDITGKDERYVNALRTQATKLSQRQTRIKPSAAPAAAVPVVNPNIAKFEKIVGDLTGEIAEVNSIVGGLDFNAASEDAIDHFSTKDDMVRRIGNQLNKVAEFGKTVAANGGDAVNGLIGKFKEVADMCDSIVGTKQDRNDADSIISDYLVDLDGACRSIVRDARNYSGTQQAGGAAANA